MRKVKFIALIILRFGQKYIPQFLSKWKVVGLVLFFVFFLAVLWKLGEINLRQTSISQGLLGAYTPDSLPTVVTNLMSEGLISLDKSGQPKANLVSGWQVNNNATIYTFKLKDGLFWNDGNKVKSSDIKFNLPDVDVSYPDESAIEFKLADSFAPFPTFLATPIFKGDTLIGLGKYKLISQQLSRGTIVKLILSPKKAENQILPKIILRFYPDEKVAKTAFELGEIDSLLGISDPHLFQNQPQIKQKKITTFNKLAAIFYNTSDSLLSDKNLRRALSLASPQINGEARAKTPIQPFSWAYNDEVKNYLDNQDMAKTYLEKVSLPKESSIILTTTPSLSSIGEKVIQGWKKAGIPTVLRVESGIPQNFQALLIQQAIPADPDQYSLWHSTQDKTNLSKYSSPRIDKDLEDGRKSADLEVRKEKYFDFQKILVEDAPATFLYFPTLNIIYRQKIEENLNKILPLQIPQI